ncbi:MAG: hypothetical protein RL518_905 [Pseudomonadota bacterium]|jgi:hypothetical protein
MKITLLRSVRLATVALLALIVTSTGARAEKRLTWQSKGTLQVIKADAITVDGFPYKLTAGTVYDRYGQHTTLSSFKVGDYVKVTFLTDRTVLELEAQQSGGQSSTGTPTPAPTPQPSRFSARLSPLGTSVSQGRSAATYQGAAGRFTLEVKIPQNTIPLATTPADAKAMVITATITRKGVVIATCSTRFEATRRKVTAYDFKTEIERTIRYGSSRTRAKKGNCILADGSQGLPIVKGGDRMTVSEPTAGEFLTGTF